jgi:hypothetical protein
MHDTGYSLADLTLNAVTYQTNYSQWPQLSDVRKPKKSQRRCFEFMPLMRFAEGDGFVSSKAPCMIIGAIIV